MSYFSQYFRDINALFKNKNNKHKLKLFLIYNRFCLKNIITTKILKIKTEKTKFLGYTFYYDNFNSFFSIFSEIFLHGIYGDMKINSKNPVIVDAGANIGVATLYFKYTYPSAKVISFEPDPETFKLLKKNCEINNLKDIILNDKALSDKIGTIKFYSFGNFEGSPGNTISKKMINFGNVKEHTVKSVTLSSLNLKKIDLLKIDVEGAEGKIIQDLEKQKKFKTISNMCLEYHYGLEDDENSLSEILKVLEKNKFDYVINPDSLIDYNIPFDAFEKTRKYVIIINCIRKKH